MPEAPVVKAFKPQDLDKWPEMEATYDKIAKRYRGLLFAVCFKHLSPEDMASEERKSQGETGPVKRKRDPETATPQQKPRLAKKTRALSVLTESGSEEEPVDEQAKEPHHSQRKDAKQQGKDVKKVNEGKEVKGSRDTKDLKEGKESGVEGSRTKTSTTRRFDPLSLLDSPRTRPMPGPHESLASTPDPRPFKGFRENVFAEYSLSHKIGQGTFGEVWKGVSRRTGQVVAIKRMLPHPIEAKEGYPITGYREIRMLKTLDHENIIKLLEIGVACGGTLTPSPQNDAAVSYFQLPF